MQYKFRGKRIDNNEWIKGSLSIEYDGTCFISYWASKCTDASVNMWEPVQEWHEVKPVTVGMWTGMKDKNGIEICEGDILKSFSPSVPSYEVFYERSHYRLRYKLNNGEWYHWGPLFRMEEIQWEGRLPLCPNVIGNIHDNPELLNPTGGQSGINNMNILDPNLKAEEQATTEAANAQESEAQDQATGASEATETEATEG